jgi:amidase
MLDAAHAFFQTHDLLLCPTVVLAPFDASLPWPKELNGHAFDNYVAWMKACSLLSALDLPAVSVPCGVTTQGLPIGLQIVGPPGADAAVLAEAAAFEAAHEFVRHVPREVRVVTAQSEEAA